MRLPNVERKHMNRATDLILNKINVLSFKDFLEKENPGLIERLKEQQEALHNAGKSLDYLTAFSSGFYACWFMIREAMKDEELN